nr:coiled-coil domain-containing protein 18-like [Tanacetum cinerariifolium]
MLFVRLNALLIDREVLEAKEKINEPKLELEKVATTLEQSESKNTELKEQVSPTTEKLEQKEKKQEDLDVNLKNLQDELKEAEEDITLVTLRQKLEKVEQKKDDLKLKLEKFETSFNNLAKLIRSQLDANNKTGLEYGNHVNGCEENDSKSVSDEEDSPVNDRFMKSNGNRAVPPLYTRNYMSPRADLSFAGLDDSVYKCKVTESISNESKVETNITKSCTNSIEKPKTDRPSALIIEE